MSNSQFAPPQHAGFLPFSSEIRPIEPKTNARRSIVPVDNQDFMGSLVLTIHHDYFVVTNNPRNKRITIRKCNNSAVHSIKSIKFLGTVAGSNVLTGSMIESILQFNRNFDRHQVDAIMGNSKDSQEYTTYIPPSSTTIEIPWIMSSSYPLPIRNCPLDLCVQIEASEIKDILLIRANDRQFDFTDVQKLTTYISRITCPNKITIECHATFSKVPALINFPETLERYKRRSCFSIIQTKIVGEQDGKCTREINLSNAGPLIGVMWKLTALYLQPKTAANKQSYHDFNLKGNHSTNPLEDGDEDPILSTKLSLDTQDIELPGSLTSKTFDPEIRQPFQCGIHLYTLGVNPFSGQDLEGKRVKTLTVEVTPKCDLKPPILEGVGSDDEDYQEIGSDNEESTVPSVTIPSSYELKPSGYSLTVMAICAQTVEFSQQGISFYDTDINSLEEHFKKLSRSNPNKPKDPVR